MLVHNADVPPLHPHGIMAGKSGSHVRRSRSLPATCADFAVPRILAARATRSVPWYASSGIPRQAFADISYDQPTQHRHSENIRQAALISGNIVLDSVSARFSRLEVWDSWTEPRNDVIKTACGPTHDHCQYHCSCAHVHWPALVARMLMPRSVRVIDWEHGRAAWAVIVGETILATLEGSRGCARTLFYRSWARRLPR
jgi:hypothetical protein